MSRFINNSSDCIKSELYLFYVPPTNTSIEIGGCSQHHPIAIIDDGPIEFNISGTEDEYIHLNRSLLYLQVSIYHKGISKITKDDKVAPINNLASSLFSQIDVSLKNESIETSNKTYAYKAYITDLLNFGKNSKETFMQSSLFFKDESGKMDSLIVDVKDENKTASTNRGLLLRKSAFESGNGTVELLTKLHSDIFNSDRYLLSSVDLNVKLIRNNNAFCLMSDGADYSIKIDNAMLIMRKAKISPSVRLAHSHALEKSTAKYPLKRVVVNSYTISKDVQNFTTPNLSNSVLPTRIIVGMVENEAYNGSYSKNPFNFQHFNIKSISLTLDSKNIPYYKGLEFDFENNKFIRGYYSLFEGIDGSVMFNGNDLSRDDYAKGYTLFAFDITPDLCSGEHFNLLRTGNLILDLSFSKNLPKAVSLIVFMEFDNMIEINKSRKVFKDYQI